MRGDERVSSDELIRRAKERAERPEKKAPEEPPAADESVSSSPEEPTVEERPAKTGEFDFHRQTKPTPRAMEGESMGWSSDATGPQESPSPLGIGTVPFRSARTLALWSQLLIGLVAIAAIFSIFAMFGQVDLLQRIENGENVTFAEAAASDNLVASAGGFYLLAFIASLVVYLVWINRSVRNLGRVRSGDPSQPLRFTPGWAVGWHFVPFMNLFRPFQVMRELYQESNPVRQGSSVVGWWWGVWLAGGVIAPGLGGFSVEPSISELLRDSYRSIAADALIVPAAVLIVLLINRITTWQESRAEQLGVM